MSLTRALVIPDSSTNLIKFVGEAWKTIIVCEDNFYKRK